MLTKPLPGASLVRGDLTKDLTSCFLFNEQSSSLYDYARGKRTGNLNNGVWSVNDAGFVVETTSSTSYIDLGKSNEVLDWTTNDVCADLTFFCKVRPTVSGQRGVSFGPRINPTDTYYVLHTKIPNQSGYIVWAVGGTDADHSLTAAANVTNNTFAFVISQARGVEIWMDGSMIASDPTKVLFWTPTNAPFVLGDASTTNVADFNGVPSQFSFFYTFQRALTGEEIRTLTSNPYSIFSHRLYYVPEEVPSIGGVEVGGSAYSSASTGIHASGTATVRARYRSTGGSYETSGIVNGGSALVVPEQIAVATGGAVAGGTVEGSLNIIADGGGVVGSSATPTIQVNISVSGGAVSGGAVDDVGFNGDVFRGGAIGGSAQGAIVDGGTPVNPNDPGQKIYNIIAIGGAEGGTAAYQPLNPTILYGLSEISPIFMDRDEFGNWMPPDLTFNEDENPFVSALTFEDGYWNACWGYYYPVPSGGVSCGGTASHTLFSSARLSTFGAYAGGRAIITRKGPSHNIRTGTARCLNSSNVIKDAEEARNQKTKIQGYTEETPAVTLSYINKNLPGWCDIGENCENGAVLPKIVKKWQGVYLPSKRR